MAAVPSIGRATRVEPNGSRGDATHALYERFHGQIFGFCFNQLGTREEAEDATQSTFLNAHRALEAGTKPDAESAWLFKIAHNVCLSRRRSAFRRGRVETPSDLQAVQDVLAAPQREGSEDLVGLTDALEQMPDNQRRAILLREWQGLSYREIAGALSLSQAAVETLIFRARRTLAGNLKDLSEPVGHVARLRRAQGAVEVGGLVAAFKTLFMSTAANTAATAAAVTSTAVIAAAPLVHENHKAAPMERAPAAGVAFHSAQHDDAAVTLVRRSSGPQSLVGSPRPVPPLAERDNSRARAAAAEAPRPTATRPRAGESQPEPNPNAGWSAPASAGADQPAAAPPTASEERPAEPAASQRPAEEPAREAPNGHAAAENPAQEKAEQISKDPGPPPLSDDERSRGNSSSEVRENDKAGRSDQDESGKPEKPGKSKG